MTDQQPARQPTPMVTRFPMPTGAALGNAYDNLYLAANGDAQTRASLGPPGALPRPWIPATCTNRQLRGELWAWLDDVATWINHQYVWDPAAGIIPACWPLHPPLVQELAVLADQRRRASLDLTSGTLEDWHRTCLPNFLVRLQSRTRTGCDEKHNPWPAQPRSDRHKRAARQRLDAFNADIDALPPVCAEMEDDESGPSPEEARWIASLRLAAQDGETIDFETGETE